MALDPPFQPSWNTSGSTPDSMVAGQGRRTRSQIQGHLIRIFQNTFLWVGDFCLFICLFSRFFWGWVGFFLVGGSGIWYCLVLFVWFFNYPETFREESYFSKIAVSPSCTKLGITLSSASLPDLNSCNLGHSLLVLLMLPDRSLVKIV